MPGPTDVRRAGPADVDALAATLARAFEDDPMTLHLFPRPAARRRALPRYFSMLLSRSFLPAGEVWMPSDASAGAAWTPPGARRPGLRDMVRLAPMVAVIGRRLPRAIAVMRAVEARHPPTPHWYLAVIGTDPPAQGRGTGSALLTTVLERCDREGHPAYLESSKEENVPFYRRHGFEITDVLRAPLGAPPLWLMWREPGSS